MAVTKTDVSADIPSSDSLLVVNDGETVEAFTENTNNTTLLGPLIVAMNWIIDQGLQAGVESIATALQRFQGGIKTDAIASETTGGDVTLTTTSTGKFKYQSGTVAASEVLTTGNYNSLIVPVTGVTVMTGATNSVDGAQGLAPQPDAGEQNLPLRGNATYSTGWESKASNFTIENGGKYIVGPSVTEITLPASPSNGDEFEIVAGNLSFIIGTVLTGDNINGSSSDLDLTEETRYHGVYVSGTTTGWRVTASDIYAPAIQVDNSINDFVISLESGKTVSTSDVSSTDTVYVVPNKGNKIALYDNSRDLWKIVTSDELSIELNDNTNTNQSIFIDILSGTPELLCVNWTNDTTPGSAAVVLFEGVLVQSGTGGTRRYLGTVRTNGVAGETHLQLDKSILIDNLRDSYNLVGLPTGSKTATSSSPVAYSTTVGEGRLEFVRGLPFNFDAHLMLKMGATGTDPSDAAEGRVGIGISSTTVDSSQIHTDSKFDSTLADSQEVEVWASLSKTNYPQGYYYLQTLVIDINNGTSAEDPLFRGTTTDGGAYGMRVNLGKSISI